MYLKCLQTVYPTTKEHMIRSLCDIFDCFTDDFKNENFMQSTSEIDVRSQLEVRISYLTRVGIVRVKNAFV